MISEPLTLGETIPRGAWLSGKVLILSSMLVGLVCAVLLSPVLFAQEPAITMFGALRGASVSPMSMSCPAPRRWVSMAAQAKEDFSRLDLLTQTKVKKLAKDVVVKAGKLKAEDMAGVTAPLGFWDPLGFSKLWDIGNLRAVELKHGRVCMLAALGMMVSEYTHPMFDGWGDGEFVSATASHYTPTASLNFWPAFVATVGAIDLVTDLTQPADAAPGDYGWDPLQLRPTNPKELLELQNKELNNGRLAMLAAAGIMAQEMVTGEKIF